MGLFDRLFGVKRVPKRAVVLGPRREAKPAPVTPEKRMASLILAVTSAIQKNDQAKLSRLVGEEVCCTKCQHCFTLSHSLQMYDRGQRRGIRCVCTRCDTSLFEIET